MGKKIRKTRGKKMINISGIIMLLMVLMLFISVIAEIFIPTYKTNPLFYGLIGAVGGLFFKSLDE